MLRQFVLFGLSLLPSALAQASNDFESGWDQAAWPIYAPDCNQGGTVSLDSTVAHSGKNSIKVAGAGGYCGHVFFGTTQVPAGDVYVRAWVKASKALTDDHISFIVMPDSTLGAGKHLRFGGMDEVMIYNRESDDATLPDLSPQGIATSADLPAGSWQCLEYHLGTDGTIETWLNGAAIPGLTVSPSVTNANANGWTRSKYVPHISGVYFGWESYGGASNTFWYDDIAIASKRVGCTAGGSSSPSSAPASTIKSTASVKATSTVAPSSPTTSRLTTLSTATVIKPATSASSPSSSSCVSPKYGQCGGIGWSGCTACAAGSTCKVAGDYYSQCM